MIWKIILIMYELLFHINNIPYERKYQKFMDTERKILGSS